MCEKNGKFKVKKKSEKNIHIWTALVYNCKFPFVGDLGLRKDQGYQGKLNFDMHLHNRGDRDTRGVRIAII